MVTIVTIFPYQKAHNLDFTGFWEFLSQGKIINVIKYLLLLLTSVTVKADPSRKLLLQCRR
ncbi:MAG: hypothetical protein ACR2LR_03850 [Hassallia sp.]